MERCDRQIRRIVCATPRLGDLLKPFGEVELLGAIDTAITLDRMASKKRSELTELQSRYRRLTPREQEVLTYVVSGFANKETAYELGTSEVTVGVHRSQIMRKLETRSMAELVRLSDRVGVRPRARYPK